MSIDLDDDEVIVRYVYRKKAGYLSIELIRLGTKIGNRVVEIRFGIGQGSGIGKTFVQKLIDLRLNKNERKSFANEKLPQKIKLV